MPAPVPSAGALIRRTLTRQRRPLAASIALVTVWQVCEAMVPVLIGVVIDRAVATGDVAQLALWGGALCVLFAVLSYSYRFGSRVFFRANQVESHLLRTEVSAHVLDPRGARTDRLPGDILTLATSDADMVGSLIRQLTLTSAAVIGLVVSAVALATIDLLLALVVLVGVPITLAITHRLSPHLAARSEARQDAIGRATGVATDLVRGLRPLKGIGAEDTALARYRGESRAAAQASVAASRWEGVLYGVTSGLSGAFLAVVALLAGLRAVEGDIGIGELVAVVGLAQFVAEPMMLLSYLVAELAQSRASAGRIVSLLATPALVQAGDQDAAGPSVLALDDVSSGPLRGVSLRVAPGQLVAVVADAPADAAALMALLHGEASPETGRVTLAGTELTALSIGQARARLLVADHAVDLFEGTLRTNVDPAARLHPDRLADVLAASAADDVVAISEHGLEEPVTVGGTTLSGGQRQRIALARALAADRAVLVLHDPTTSVDAVTEHRIAGALGDVRRHGSDSPSTSDSADSEARSTLVLTSSPALLAHADLVVVLRGGRVAATGTHRELVEHPDHGAAYRAAVLR